MKVLLINGGPHETGATFTALSEVASALEEQGVATNILWLGNAPIGGCTACNACKALGLCARNDIVNDVIAHLSEYDGFVFGSPVHYAAASGTLSSFMARLFFSSAKLLRHKPAAAVVSCRRGGASAAFDEINKYFTISEMPVVSSNYWNQIHGRNAEEARRDEEGLQTMRILGTNMAYLLRCIDAGRAAGLQDPAPLTKIQTNYIR